MAKIRNGLYKLGKSWYICVKVNGKNKRKSFGSDKRAAELALAEVKKQRAVARATDDWSGLEKLTEPKKQKTFAEAADDYVSERAQFKPSTLSTYHGILKNHLLPEFANQQVSRITEEQIARFQSKIATNLSARRTNGVMQLFRSILKVCVRRKVVAENAAEYVDRVKEPQANIDPLTRDELALVLSKIDHFYQTLFICLAWTGARPNELLALRWKDIDWQRGEIHINKGRVRGKEGLPKTGSSQRYIPMLPPVLEALKQQKSTSTANLDGYVFMSKKGQPINKHLDRIWKRALIKSGLRHRPSYQLRHTFASLLLQQGIDPGWIAKILGHSNLQTTFRHYFRFIPDSAKQNQRILVTMFGCSSEQSMSYTTITPS